MKHSRSVNLNAIAWDAMGKYGFAPQFSKAVQREVSALSPMMLQNAQKGTRDLRMLLWSSIDNIDSKDLDQLEYAEQGNDGEVLIRVAIADVDLFVPKDCQTDRHAAHNGTSVYTGVETFPMLPDSLSKGITSLLPGQDRMAIVIEYTVLPDGTTRTGNLYRALVHNKAKLVYEETGDWLEGTELIPRVIHQVPGLEEQVLLQNEVAKRLRASRVAHGALELNTIEAEPVMEEGTVRDLVIQRQNQARCLIEEFMVAANGVMVSFLGDTGLPMIQRVVRIPKHWDGIVETAALHGERLPAEPDAKALSTFLIRQKAADPERFPDLSLTIVKLLGNGEYLTLEPGKEPFGHFALAVTDYTHATAPNRRYVDMINQRLVKSVLDGKVSPYSLQELFDLSTWLTDREKASKKVERFVRKAAAAVLLGDRIGETFPALVTGASEKGTYVRLISPPAEGRIIEGEQGLRVGQKIVVRLAGTDPYKGHIDFVYGGVGKDFPASTRRKYHRPGRRRR